MVKSAAYIALGSNLGDRELNLLRAIAEIGKLPDAKIKAVSGFYDTQPVGPAGQDNFLNCALLLETSLTPHQLLAELQLIETDVFKRKRTVRWGPRTMDLDILFFDDLIIAEDALTIPHPRLHERRFVLAPLAEIAPGLVHPQSGKTIAKLLRGLKSPEKVIKI
jgi:2-amino-4-hydroxy-6-hydroxymethyldihydropteridine diphosphokinase